jgi:hypothetical protein
MLPSAFSRLDEQFIGNYASKDHFKWSGEKAVQQQQWWDRDRLLIGPPQDPLSPSKSRQLNTTMPPGSQGNTPWKFLPNTRFSFQKREDNSF